MDQANQNPGYAAVIGKNGRNKEGKFFSDDPLEKSGIFLSLYPRQSQKIIQMELDKYQLTDLAREALDFYLNHLEKTGTQPNLPEPKPVPPPKKKQPRPNNGDWVLIKDRQKEGVVVGVNKGWYLIETDPNEDRLKVRARDVEILRKAEAS